MVTSLRPYQGLINSTGSLSSCRLRWIQFATSLTVPSPYAIWYMRSSVSPWCDTWFLGKYLFTSFVCTMLIYSYNKTFLYLYDYCVIGCLFTWMRTVTDCYYVCQLLSKCQNIHDDDPSVRVLIFSRLFMKSFQKELNLLCYYDISWTGNWIRCHIMEINVFIITRIKPKLWYVSYSIEFR